LQFFPPSLLVAALTVTGLLLRGSLVLTQRPTPQTVAAALALVTGLVLVATAGQHKTQRAAIGFALLTGVCIAGYSLIDAAAPAVNAPVTTTVLTSIDVAFPVAIGFRLDPASLANFDEITLGGTGRGTAAIDTGVAPIVLADGKTVRYRITGAFLLSGDVTVTYTGTAGSFDLAVQLAQTSLAQITAVGSTS